MSNDKKLPARHSDQVPTQSDPESRLPAASGASGGLIKQGLSRFWAKVGRGTTDENTALIDSQRRYVKAYGELADTAYDTKRKVDRLRHDLPSQLGADRVQHQDKMDQVQHEIELKKVQRAAELATLKAHDERDRMTRDLDYMKDASDKRRVLHHAARQEIDAKIRRDTVARTADMQVEQAINAFLTGDYATLDKLMRAKHGFEQAWGEDQRPEPVAQTGLEERLAILQEMLAKAKAENASAEFRLKLHEEIDAIKDQIEAAAAGDTIP